MTLLLEWFAFSLAVAIAVAVLLDRKLRGKDDDERR